jgi:hypothetical protein
MIKYRSLHKWKYQLLENYAIQTDIFPDHNLNMEFVSLTTDGMLVISKDYAWDGASGPAIDTKDFMRGSLVHDALYQLCRAELLDYRLYRDKADRLLVKVCKEAGMCKFRCWYVYWGLRIFAEKAARPQKESPNIFEAP